MPKPIVVSVYNFKGGVGKTTASYNIAYILSQVLKLRVLLVDADPQDNLTGLIKAEDFIDIEKAKAYDQQAKEQEQKGKFITLGNLFSDILNNKQPQSLDRAGKVELTQVHDYANLFLLPGDNATGKLDRKISMGIEGSAMSLDLPGYISNLLREVGRLNNIDIIVVDLNPGFGDFNCSMMMGADYFVVPFCAEYSSLQAMQSLQRTIPEWYESFHQEDYRRSELGLVKTVPKFLGAFPQKVQIRKRPNESIDEMIQACGTWVKCIYEEADKFVEILREMVVSIRGREERVSMLSDAFNLNKFVGIRDFASTGMDVQASGRPISDLKYPHRHLKDKEEGGIRTVPLGSDKRDKKKQAFGAFKRVIGECFKNLTKEDLDLLEGPGNPFAIRVNLFSHIAENVDTKEYLPLPQTPVHEEQDEHWYDRLEIDRLLTHYFREDATVFRAGAVSLEEMNNDPFIHAIQDMHTRVALNEGITRGVLPINLRGNHWVLLYFLFPTGANDRAEIYYFDPFEEEMPPRMGAILAQFYKDKAPTILEGRVQEDGYNCGPWVVEAARAMAINGALPERGFDIHACREEHRGVVQAIASQAQSEKKRSKKRKATTDEPEVGEQEKKQRKRAKTSQPPAGASAGGFFSSSPPSSQAPLPSQASHPVHRRGGKR